MFVIYSGGKKKRKKRRTLETERWVEVGLKYYVLGIET